jgi:UDP-glucose 4-epimerase
MIEAYAEGFGFKAWIFRFVSILGPRYTHGHVFDFYKRLLGDPRRLDVLGNGHQRKSYLNIADCIDAMLCAIGSAPGKINVFNLSTDEYGVVNDSIGWITSYLGLTPALVYSGGDRGWVGDNPFIFLDTGRIRALDWRPRHTIRDSVLETLKWLSQNRWVMDRRK